MDDTKFKIPWPLKVTSRTWTRIKCSFSSQSNPLSTGWTWSQSNFPPKTRLNSCLLLSRSRFKSTSTQSQVCVTLCVTQSFRCGSSWCGWFKHLSHLSGNMAPLYPDSTTPHDGNCLKTICVISLTHFQHFLLLDFQIYHLFTAFSLFSAFFSLSGDPRATLLVAGNQNVTSHALHAGQRLYHNPWKTFGNYDLSLISTRPR